MSDLLVSKIGSDKLATSLVEREKKHDKTYWTYKEGSLKFSPLPMSPHKRGWVKMFYSFLVTPSFFPEESWVAWWFTGRGGRWGALASMDGHVTAHRVPNPTFCTLIWDMIQFCICVNVDWLCMMHHVIHLSIIW